MKKILCLFFMILTCCAASAQKQHRIDSLQRALSLANDTTKVHIYQQLAPLSADDNLQAGLRYAQDAFSLANRGHYVDLKTSVLTDIGSF